MFWSLTKLYLTTFLPRLVDFSVRSFNKLFMTKLKIINCTFSTNFSFLRKTITRSCLRLLMPDSDDRQLFADFEALLCWKSESCDFFCNLWHFNRWFGLGFRALGSWHVGERWTSDCRQSEDLFRNLKLMQEIKLKFLLRIFSDHSVNIIWIHRASQDTTGLKRTATTSWSHCQYWQNLLGFSWRQMKLKSKVNILSAHIYFCVRFL